MERYKELLQKKINVEFNGIVLNSYKLTEIIPTEIFMVGFEGTGRLYNCSVDWENKNIDGAYPKMDFDELTLRGLTKKGLSVCPMEKLLIYRVDNTNGISIYSFSKALCHIKRLFTLNKKPVDGAKSFDYQTVSVEEVLANVNDNTPFCE